MERGVKQGLERGVKQGLEQGVKQGSERSQREMVLNLLTKFTPEQTAEFSGIPLSKVNAIAKANKST